MNQIQSCHPVFGFENAPETTKHIKNKVAGKKIEICLRLWDQSWHLMIGRFLGPQQAEHAWPATWFLKKTVFNRFLFTGDYLGISQSLFHYWPLPLGNPNLGKCGPPGMIWHLVFASHRRVQPAHVVFFPVLLVDERIKPWPTINDVASMPCSRSKTCQWCFAAKPKLGPTRWRQSNTSMTRCIRNVGST